MAGNEPTTSDDAELEALERENVRLKLEHEQLLFERGIEYGRQLERRKAKEPGKPVGRPAAMAPELAAFMVAIVDQRAQGVPIAKAVADFLKTMARGRFFRSRGQLPDSPAKEWQAASSEFEKIWKRRGTELAECMDGLSKQETAERTYYRDGVYYRQKAADLIKSLKSQ